MNKIINRLQNEFNKSPDLVIKSITINIFKKIYIAYLETVSSSNKVNDYILKNLILKKDNITKGNIASFIAAPNTLEIKNTDKCEFYLTNGFSLVIIDNKILAIETRADINRAVSDSQVESSINGPKDAFTENIQINIGLIKRRIKSSTLKTENRTIGRKTLTNISILYFEDIADKNLVNNVLEKIDTIDIDGIVDSSSFGFLLEDENKSVYPTYMQTERPDIVATSLLEGKIAIVVDTTPFVLIIPAFFIDFINPGTDNYNKGKNINFIKILRISAFIISMMAPSIYIAVMNYNQETIPTNLLLNFAIERGGVPFPTIIETLIMLFVCEILKESDLRFPSSYGSAISILGAIVLGEASVSAGIASPITIIVIAVTFISSLTFTTFEINNALRYFRAIFILLSGLFGLYGITLGLFYFLIYTTTSKSFNKPYFAPISPYNKEYFNNSVLKKSLKKDTRRSTLFTHTNIIKQTEDLWKKY